MEKHPATDRNNLIEHAYATDEAFRTRTRIHEEYSYPKINFNQWVLSHLEWQGDERVLDIGAGPGNYFDLLRPFIPNGQLVAGDLSFGMARRARQHDVETVLNADVQSLPFARGSFDVVLANHVFQHVPNIDQAISEIHRVLKPTGCLVAAINSRYTMPELDQLVRRTYSLLGVRMADADERLWPFSLEDGPRRLGKYFLGVARYDMPSAFVFSTAGPVVEYVNSTRALREGRLPQGVTWEEFITVFGDQVTRLINHFGELIVGKLAGVLVASDAGYFVAEYAARLKANL